MFTKDSDINNSALKWYRARTEKKTSVLLLYISDLITGIFIGGSWRKSSEYAEES